MRATANAIQRPLKHVGTPNPLGSSSRIQIIFVRPLPSRVYSKAPFLANRTQDPFDTGLVPGVQNMSQYLSPQSIRLVDMYTLPFLAVDVR